MVEQRLIGAHLAGRRGVVEAALEVGELAGVEAEAGRHFGGGAEHALEDAVVERAGGGGLGARHDARAAGKRERAGGGRRAEQELAAVETHGHSAIPPGRGPSIRAFAKLSPYSG